MREDVILTDSDLVAMMKNGDQTAFNEIYNRYWKSLYHSAYRILQDEEGASDALQEVFTSLWQRRNNVEIISLKAYLHQAARFTVLKAIRAQKTDQQFYKRLAEVTTEIFTENPLLFKEQQHLIQHLLDRLPEDCQEIFKMSREENLTYKQIAEVLQISEKTVEKKMTKSLKLIREGLSIELCLTVIFYYGTSNF
ncbi:RNA polymerase sigma-70 factor [Pedobacter frigoris]|uniref:RNA polymerase sigma factor n=1 Tax=Pedobacter frigoris TaxID=2571272 RepID=UPI00292DE4B3|nr:RNA polymerase sigma-70 factor [Pedobacter frigoris]